MRAAVLGSAAKDLVNFRGHLMGELARAGHTVYGLAPGGTPEIAQAVDRLGATFVPVEFDRTGLNPFREAVDVVRLWRSIKDLRLDLLLAYELKSVVFGTLAARWAGVPRRFAMITGRGTTLQGSPETARDRVVRRIVKRLYASALPRTQGVLFQNPDDRAFFASEGMLPGHVPFRIINGSGVDLGFFAPAGPPPEPVTFLFVGRLLRNKGVREFAEASRILRERGVAFRSRILGPLDPNPNGITRAQVEGWVAQGSVEWLGEAKDVRPALRESHALVLPSYGEGTPRSVLEAMSMGKAIVTTDAPGCRETVKDGLNGLMVPVGDVEALARAMERLATDAGLAARFGAEGRRVAEAKYDVRLVTADILDFMGVTGPVA